MAGEQRKCANCRFFRDAGIAGNGWCTHPKRQTTSDARILVRAGELACRNSWGSDLFQSKDDSQVAADSSADLPAGSRDDEVTSVITPPDRPSKPEPDDAEDRVVSDRPAKPQRDDDDGYNDAAHRDQDERARIIARGSRDALMRARERHSSRRARSEQDIDDDTSGPAPSRRDRVVTHQARFTDRRRTRFDRSIPDTDPVPREEVASRYTAANRFDSVPEIDPGFDLPGWRADDEGSMTHEHESSMASDSESDAPTASDDIQEVVSSYEHALERARRTRQEKLRSRRPIRHTRVTPTQHQNAEEDSLLEYHEPREDEAPWDDRDEVAAEAPVDSPLPDLDATDDLDDPDDRIGLSATTEYDERSLDQGYSYDGDPSPYPDDEAWDETVGAQAEPTVDDWDAWYDDETPVTQPAPRRGGWLSRFGLRRPEPTTWHDDAMVTRHADIEDDLDHRSGRWDDHQASTESYLTDDPEWDDLAEETVTIYRPRRPYSATDDLAEETVTTYRPRRPYSATDDHAETQNDIENDVAYDNMGAEDWDPNEPYQPHEDHLIVEREPIHDARPRHEAMHRQRHMPELPDLDDNLFEEQFERSPKAHRSSLPFDREPVREHLAAATGSEEIPPVPVDESHGAPQARESYFRAARFRDWAETPPSRRPDDFRQDDRASRLPDLAEPDLDLREVVARGNELIDMTIDIAPDLPRECRTCRSFRSADGGARGWCTNEFAFTHRRMVNEDDLACDSTIGCWWVPADRYWLIEEQDGYAATPRMDRLIARKQGTPSRSASGAS